MEIIREIRFFEPGNKEDNQGIQRVDHLTDAQIYAKIKEQAMRFNRFEFEYLPPREVGE